MPAQCMHAVDVRFTATPNWRERRARNGQNLTKSKKCTSDKKSRPVHGHAQLARAARAERPEFD